MHLDSDVLDRNFHQSLYQGLRLNVNLLIISPFVAISYYLGKSYFKIFLSRQIKKDFGNGRVIAQVKKFFGFKNRKNNYIERKYWPGIKTSFLSILLMVIFLDSIISAETKGYDAAKNMKTAIELKEFPIVKLKNNKSNSIAYLYCGSRNCAGLDTITKEIVYFPQNGHRIKEPSSLKATNKSR